jgi:hypothetical protein
MLDANLVNEDGFFTTRTDLVRTTMTVGGHELAIYARSNVDVERLAKEIDRTKSLGGGADAGLAGTDDIYRRVAANRQRFYPDEPLVVVGRPAGVAGGPFEKAKPVRQFLLWNDYSFRGEVWYTTCPTKGATVATLFVQNFSGEEDFYAKTSTNGGYGYIATVGDFDFGTLAWYITATKKNTIGYAWETIDDSESHIVVFCFA